MFYRELKSLKQISVSDLNLIIYRLFYTVIILLCIMFSVIFVGLCVDVTGSDALFTRQIDRGNVPPKTEPTCILRASPQWNKVI